MTESFRPPLAFIGLGALGAPMAANLLAAGFPLSVHNRTRSREASLLAAGAAAAPTPAAAAAAADWLCLCLTDGAAAEAVLFGAAQPAALGLRPGATVIDFSTIDPAVSRSLAERLGRQGVAYLDAPVTGGTEGAKAGSLSVLVGGTMADLERARPLLEVVGSRITHLGPVGCGQQAKAVNQVLVAGSYAAVAEAMALGQRLGLPMAAVCQALASGAAGSWALENRAGGMLEGSFPLGFKLALHRKDLAIALAAAAATGLELPIGERVAAIEDALIEAGHGDEDVSALIRWFKG
ncbi:NAD(P)-dependent oxidoreductase [Synechococcus sp. CS-602]|uniref:NAD(P)-dependent oxidoreductase n=1 Tax=Synechococcaceae TaxID=1890426 RepID=UPI0008FF744A|nr:MULTISPECIES: NAD(P)-dependent oxidoreductase [Synechococcaceae]MCT4363716.1 NAD(P)-dependent oxidoreductase [Candidatus Regnicoccus frigidus MAG-AL1]APD47923.1 tartronate semialdehyde reductase [Synechococcus sp. SynAce01]MCT0200953.1 NAD(P)-dependent oxidoreductase [Synechococcus sp. CS-603]MCT0204953.1 NAD(P)-dependent oxidoreductase [Synechococcus sp. CS-602]MCT0244781.1 NAD(P)-dependent oxidoreductase [Synechococcus sp. CS-601]